nr:MAG TPA: hypothetical protein [Caudoviricetes sp.]DAZ38310.1 MAG TPA: hypothetical protein [Caudoviricetes sp.]
MEKLLQILIYRKADNLLECSLQEVVRIIDRYLNFMRRISVMLTYRNSFMTRVVNILVNLKQYPMLNIHL